MRIEPSEAISSVELARVHGMRVFSLHAGFETTKAPVALDTPVEIVPRVFALSKNEPPLDVPIETMKSSDEALTPWRLYPEPVSVHEVDSTANATTQNSRKA
jgi:histidinol-phosphate/aromatic aminotransferase/cobyric acid decarboxylase-like protein